MHKLFIILTLSLAACANTVGDLLRFFNSVDVAYERGDEYLAIIDGKVYDYENNRIYSLNFISK